MKKKPIDVSWTSIDTALWEMREKCRLMQQAGYKDAHHVYLAVERYIATSRASAEWCRVFINLDKSRVESLIKRALNSKDTSMDGMMATINRCLKVEQVA